jgi:hypothetical protein
LKFSSSRIQQFFDSNLFSKTKNHWRFLNSEIF